MKFNEYVKEKSGDTFEKYRTAIKDKFNFDIAKWKDQLIGGKADNKKITDFPLDQILLGIPIEMEHTSDPGKALSVVLDHLVEFPKTYYTRLKRMEREAKKAGEGSEE